MDKTNLTETEIRSRFIRPAIVAAGWDDAAEIREEYYFTDGRMIIADEKATRGERNFADYLLRYRHVSLAVETRITSIPVAGRVVYKCKAIPTRQDAD